MCLGEDNFEWSLRGDLLATWTWMSKSDPVWDFPGTIPVSKISVSFSLSSTSGIPVMCRLFLWMLSHSSHRFFHICFILFPSLSSGWVISIVFYITASSAVTDAERVTDRKARGLQTGNRLQVSDIFISLKCQEETNGWYFFSFFIQI